MIKRMFPGLYRGIVLSAGMTALFLCLVSCGQQENNVSQEEYDELISQINELQESVDSQKAETLDEVPLEEDTADASKEESATVVTAVRGRESVDGQIIVPTMDGQIASAAGESGWLSPDRTKFIYIKADDTLYIRDMATGVDTYVPGDALYVYQVTNKGFLYNDMQANVHRYMYSTSGDGVDINLGKTLSSRTGNDSLNIAYTWEGKIYRLLEESIEPEEIADYEFVADILGISNDGNMIYWSESTNDSYDIAYCYVNGVITELLRGFNEQAGGLHSIICNDNYGFACNSVVKSLFIVSKERIVEASLDDYIYTRRISTENGEISIADADNINGVYVMVGDENHHNLTFVDMDGKVNTVLPEIDYFIISDSFLYYIDKDKNLKYGNIKSGVYEEQGTIAESVSRISDYCIDGHLYFLEENEDYSQILCAFKDGKKIKIAQSMKFSVDGNYPYGISTIGAISVDGASLYYQDIWTDYYSMVDKAPLYRYDFGADEPVLIDNDVYIGSMDSGYYPNLIDNNSFYYLKYEQGEDFDTRTYKWCYYDGSRAKEIVGGIRK